MKITHLALVALTCLMATVACNKSKKNSEPAPTMDQRLDGYWELQTPLKKQGAEAEMPYRFRLVLNVKVKTSDGIQTFAEFIQCGLYGKDLGLLPKVKGDKLEPDWVLAGEKPNAKLVPFNYDLKIVDQNTLLFNGYTYIRVTHNFLTDSKTTHFVCSRKHEPVIPAAAQPAPVAVTPPPPPPQVPNVAVCDFNKYEYMEYRSQCDVVSDSGASGLNFDLTCYAWNLNGGGSKKRVVTYKFPVAATNEGHVRRIFELHGYNARSETRNQFTATRKFDDQNDCNTDKKLSEVLDSLRVLSSNPSFVSPDQLPKLVGGAAASGGCADSTGWYNSSEAYRLFKDAVGRREMNYSKNDLSTKFCGQAQAEGACVTAQARAIKAVIDQVDPDKKIKVITTLTHLDGASQDAAGAPKAYVSGNTVSISYRLRSDGSGPLCEYVNEARIIEAFGLSGDGTLRVGR